MEEANLAVWKEYELGIEKMKLNSNKVSNNELVKLGFPNLSRELYPRLEKMINRDIENIEIPKRDNKI